MFSRRLRPLVNGCNLVTSVMSNVRICNGSCRFRWRPVDMPLVGCYLFPFSRLLSQYKQITVPVYYESYWISGNVNDALGRAYVGLPRSRFGSHHMPVMLLFLPLQRRENSEGGPPCNSMPSWCGFGPTILTYSFSLVQHRNSALYALNKYALLWFQRLPSKLKGARGKVRSRRPRYFVPCSI